MRRLTSAVIAMLLWLGVAGTAYSSPITLGDFVSPVVEDFEGIIGVSVPGGLFSGGMYGAPPTGFVLPSGLTLTLPSPNPSTGADFIIGDYLIGMGTYGLLENGFIGSPADLHSGTAFAGAGDPVSPVNTFGFSFPSPVNRVGMFASSVKDGGIATPITLSIFDTGGGLIESFTFTSILPVPLTDANFIGLGSATPIGSFTIGAPTGSIDFFVFDDVLFEAEAVPEPASLTLLGLGGLALAGYARRRGRRSGSC